MVRRESNDSPSRGAADAAAVRRVFDQMPPVMALFEGPELRVSATTAAYRTLIGPEHVLGRPLREVLAEMTGRGVFEILERVYATGRPAVLREVLLPRSDVGHPADRWLDVTAHPYRAPDGGIAGIVCDVVDVTAQVRDRQHGADAGRTPAAAPDMIAALQRELLPAGVPLLPGAQVAAGYLLADPGTGAGGDWFDALVLSDGRLGLVVGDVVGHGVAATATMGQVRSVLRERLAATADPVAALAATDVAATDIPGAAAATACVVALDPGTGELTYCTAGHPPPLLIDRDGQARFLAATGAGPFGFGAAVRVAGTDRLAVDGFALLYTDGLLDRAGIDPAVATVDLVRAAGDVAADRVLRTPWMLPVERLCTRTMELLAGDGGYRDDITLLAAQRRTPTPGLDLRIVDDPLYLADLRAAVADWLDRIGAAPADIDALQHAVGELVANAVEHAEPDSAEPGVVTLAATLSPDGRVHARVADAGCWHEPRPSHNGLGLQIVAGLVDHLDLDRTPAGTTATITHRLTRPAPVLTAADLGARRPASPAAGLTLEQPTAQHSRLRVGGPVDAAAAVAFEHGVREAGAAGTRSLTLDLAGVSLLASAGVAVLHRLRREHADRQTHLQLYAPLGSPADTVLTLVGLGHTTVEPGGA